MPDCDCTDEYGPCERHTAAVLAQRVGSSNRSADELCVVYLEDASDIDAECLSPYGRDVLERAQTALRDGAGSWLDDHELADELRNVAYQVEQYLDAWTLWDDGYTILRPTDDCPLLV